MPPELIQQGTLSLHRKSQLEKPHVDKQPAFGQHRVANELTKQGIMVSGSGVRSMSHDLESN